MARSDVTKQNIAGFVEKVINDAGTEQVIDYKKVFGPIFEEYMRENEWMELMDWTYGDEERVVEKINYQALRDSEVDFDPTKRASGATVKPEQERIKIEEEKEIAAEWYDRDFQKSNGLETVGQRITSQMFKIPDGKIDAYIEAKFTEYALASSVTPLELDIEALAEDITPENGKTVFVAIKNQLMKFIKSAKDNPYSEGSKYNKENVKIAISQEVEELITAYKSGFIDQSGLLNVGVFGSAFRNVQMKTMTEMGQTGDQPVHVLIFTKRAVQGTFMPSIHSQVIPEQVNQTSHMNKASNTYGYGTKQVFENEITAIAQPVVVAPSEIEEGVAEEATPEATKKKTPAKKNTSKKTSTKKETIEETKEETTPVVEETEED